MGRSLQAQILGSMLSVSILSAMIFWRLAAADGECSEERPCTMETAPCCSQRGFCGGTEAYCTNCQVSKSLTTSGSCPAPVPNSVNPSICKDHNICAAGSCCSKDEHCGTSDEHCGSGCLGGACYSTVMSTGTKFGIGLGRAFGVLALICVVMYVRREYTSRSNQKEVY